MSWKMSAVLSGLALAFFTLPSNSARATGGESGGGGKAALCTDPQGKKYYRLLDYLRAEGPEWNYMKLVPAPGRDEFEKAKNLFKRIFDYDPIRSSKFQLEVDSFKSNSQFYGNWDFYLVKDTTEDGLPKNCTGPVMIVRQKPPMNDREKLYRINEELWNAPNFSVDDKAGLIVHEIVLRAAQVGGSRDQSTDVASYYNAYISSDLVASQGEAGYNKIVQSKFIDGSRCYHSQILLPLNPKNASFAGQILNLDCGSVDLNWANMAFGIRMLPKTLIKLGARPVEIVGQGSLRIQRKGYQISYLEFGYPTGVCDPSDSERTVEIQGKQILVSICGNRLGYDEEGNVVRATLKTPQILKDYVGREFSLPAGFTAYFRNGKLLHVGLSLRSGGSSAAPVRGWKDRKLRCDSYWQGGTGFVKWDIEKLEMSFKFDKSTQLYEALMTRKDHSVLFVSQTAPKLDPFENVNPQQIANGYFEALVENKVPTFKRSRCISQYFKIPIVEQWFCFKESYTVDGYDKWGGMEDGDLDLQARRLPPPNENDPAKKTFEVELKSTYLTKTGEAYGYGDRGRFLCTWK